MGVGKTQISKFLFVYQTMLYAIKHKINFKVLYFALEESKEEFLDSLFIHLARRIHKVNLNRFSLSGHSTTAIDKKQLDAIKATEVAMANLINNIEVIDNRYKPSDLYNTCRRFAEKWGTFVKDEEGNDKQYIPNDKQQITLVVTDHISLLDPEYNEVSKTFMSKQQSMAKWHTHYCRRILAKEWKWSVLNVQQQALDSAKEQYNYKGTSIINKVLPSLEGLANNKEIGRDDYVSLGLFSPDMFNLPEFRGYGIDEGKSTDMGDRFRSLHLLKNRFGTPNKILPLYFDGRYTYFKELPLATSPNMNYFYNLLKK